MELKNTGSNKGRKDSKDAAHKRSKDTDKAAGLGEPTPAATVPAPADILKSTQIEMPAVHNSFRF
jgi:hypothetical protein